MEMPLKDLKTLPDGMMVPGVSGKVERVFGFKSGESNGREWTRTGFLFEDGYGDKIPVTWWNAPSELIGNDAQDLKGRSLKIAAYQTDDGLSGAKMESYTDKEGKESRSISVQSRGIEVFDAVTAREAGEIQGGRVELDSGDVTTEDVLNWLDGVTERVATMYRNHLSISGVDSVPAVHSTVNTMLIRVLQSRTMSLDTPEQDKVPF